MSFFRFSLTISALALSLAACDRQEEPDAQQQDAFAGQKQDLKTGGLSGEIDRTQAGTLMPALTVSQPDGTQLNLGALQGEPVLLNLWATWCAPCVVEMPLLDNLADEMGDDLRVLTVSQDLQGAEKVEPFFAEAGFRNLEPWLDPENALGFSMDGNAGLPITVLYDASGRELFRVAGGYHWDSEEAVAQIREALAQSDS